MNFQAVLDDIHQEISPMIGRGRVANYIPELAKINPKQFGMALLDCKGNLFTVGDAQQRFSIQSISKVMSLAQAMQLIGTDVWDRVGREPSGTAFNSLVQLESENGKPRNPFINAGAIVVTDIIESEIGGAGNAVLDFIRNASSLDHIAFDTSVAKSEAQAGYRNAALANFLKSFGRIDNEPLALLDAYYQHCSIAMSCEEIAHAFLFLARNGQSLGGKQVLSPVRTKYINALMLTCGTYDAVGDFAYRVGLPAKSGVGGGLVAVMPGQFSVCVWSPGLDKQGNSLVGGRALDLLTSKTGISVF